MKATLEFNLPEEQEEFEMAQRASEYKDTLEQIWLRVFRPYQKHGYENEELNKLIESEPKVGLAIEMLTEIYREVLRGHELF